MTNVAFVTHLSLSPNPMWNYGPGIGFLLSQALYYSSETNIRVLTTFGSPTSTVALCFLCPHPKLCDSNLWLTNKPGTSLPEKKSMFLRQFFYGPKFLLVVHFQHHSNYCAVLSLSQTELEPQLYSKDPTPATNSIFLRKKYLLTCFTSICTFSA